MFQSIMTRINHSHPSGGRVNTCMMTDVSGYQNLGSG